MSAVRERATLPRRVGGACALLAAIALLIPAAASAVVACEYNSGAEVLNVTISAENNPALLAVSAGQIQVREFGPVLSCTNGPATLANTDFVNVFDNSGADTSVSILHPADFGGLGINLVMGGGTGDKLLLLGATNAGNELILGSNGVDSDGDGNIDINFIASTPEEIVADGGERSDFLSGRGSPATGSPVTPTSLTLGGAAGDDTLEGSEIGDLLKGDTGNDFIHGYGGDDTIEANGLQPEDDSVDGGSGKDTMRQFSGATTPLTLNLSLTGPQRTGYGTDTIAGVENAEGTSGADTMIGGPGPNRLIGSSGNDTIAGRGGDDVLLGNTGIDTVSYASAPAGVVVNLESGLASGAAGADTVQEFENVVGSAFADKLIGSKNANTITPLTGTDTVQALAGPDTVLVRDGIRDDASCGTGKDRAVADRLSLDTIHSDCELVDAVPEPGGGKAPAGRLILRLSSAHAQRVVAKKVVVVRVGCPQEDCAIVAKAGAKAPKLRLKAARKKLAAGRTTVLKLHLNSKQRRRIAARLRAGKKAKLKVTVVATDAAGASASRTLVVTAKL